MTDNVDQSFETDIHTYIHTYLNDITLCTFFCTLSKYCQYTVSDKCTCMDYFREGVDKGYSTNCKPALNTLRYFRPTSTRTYKLCALQYGLHFLNFPNDYHICSLPSHHILTFTLAHLPVNVTSLWISQQVKSLRSQSAQKEKKIPHQFQNIVT